MTSDLMPRLGGARTWKDDEPLECVSVVPDGPDVVSFSFRSPSGALSSCTESVGARCRPPPGTPSSRPPRTLRGSPSGALTIG